MDKTEKRCPRCGSSFTCNHGDTAHCQCSGVRLSESARSYLAAHYKDCLCRRCLDEIAEIYA